MPFLHTLKTIRVFWSYSEGINTLITSQGISWVTWWFTNSLHTSRNNSRPVTKNLLLALNVLRFQALSNVPEKKKLGIQNFGFFLCTSPEFKLSQKRLQPSFKMYRQEVVKQISHLWDFFLKLEYYVFLNSILELWAKKLPAKKSIGFSWQLEQEPQRWDF